MFSEKKKTQIQTDTEIDEPAAQLRCYMATIARTVEELASTYVNLELLEVQPIASYSPLIFIA